MSQEILMKDRGEERTARGENKENRRKKQEATRKFTRKKNKRKKISGK